MYPYDPKMGKYGPNKLSDSGLTLVPDGQGHQLCFFAINALNGVLPVGQLVQAIEQQHVGACHDGVMQVPADAAGGIDDADADRAPRFGYEAEAGRFIGGTGIEYKRAYGRGKLHLYHTAQRGMTIYVQ